MLAEDPALREHCPKISTLFLIAAFVSVAAQAQVPKVAKKPPGSLGGQVVNAKGAPVAGAQILWQVADGETPHLLHTDAQGKFLIPTLRSGAYDLRASADGSWSEWEHNVFVRPGAESSITLRLTLKSPGGGPVVELKGTMHVWDVPVAGALPHDPAVDPKGNIWFTLQQAGLIARFDPETHEWKMFKPPTEDSGPHGLVSDAAGNIWFTENYAAKIGRLNAKSGAITEYEPTSAKDPHTPVFGPDSGLWFTSQDSNVIGRIDVLTGQFREYAVPTQDAHPYGIVSAGDALWFCELTGHKLGRVDPETGTITEYSPADKGVDPRRLVALGGAIYFTDFGGGRLGRFTIADKKFKLWSSPSGSDSEPYGIATDSTGKIWYEESATRANKLVRFDPATESFRTFPMPAANSSVRNIVRDAKGRLWMPLSLANKVAVVE